ncbi:glycosyl hydrolase family 28-related protein [Caballeronia sp. DA-9]|uniref:glycosyl hydrolase family 28-related protein n=1 Tax=Caballeronia sp. DA-9 TaxID=3436237 RepID=UPI003F66C1F6
MLSKQRQPFHGIYEVRHWKCHDEPNQPTLLRRTKSGYLKLNYERLMQRMATAREHPALSMHSMKRSQNPRRRFVINTTLSALLIGAGDRARAATRTPQAGSFSHELAMRDAFIVTPLIFGAKGDGISDDTAALNAMYAHVRGTSQRTVFLRGRTYLVKGSIYARDVTTIGEGATLTSRVDSAKASCAFEWGGSDTFVTELVFDLSNVGKDAMQGVLNAVNDASNQRFFRNRVFSRTTEPSKLQSNIFGSWFLGTGLNGLYVQDNVFEKCSYGVQINNQDGMERRVREKPLGRPSRHLHISGNSCLDASIGVNTPHIMCSDVVIEGNTIAPSNLQLDLPLNVAHVTDLVIRGNTVASNSASANGTLHVEDASGAIAITGNVVTALRANNGIQFGVDPSVSHDARPVTRAIIADNHVQGSVTRGETTGILLPDPGTTDTIITGNYVSGFAQGINAVAESSVSGNTITNCPTPLRLTKRSATGQNIVK